MKASVLFFLTVAALLYFGAVVYAISRGRDVKASLKIPFALFMFETKEPGTGQLSSEQENGRARQAALKKT